MHINLIKNLEKFKTKIDIIKSLDKNDKEIIDINIYPKINEIIHMSIKNQAKFADSITYNSCKDEKWCLEQLEICNMSQSELKSSIYYWNTTSFANLAFIAINAPNKTIRHKFRKFLENAIEIMLIKIKQENKIKEEENKLLLNTLNIGKK